MTNDWKLLIRRDRRKSFIHSCKYEWTLTKANEVVGSNYAATQRGARAQARRMKRRVIKKSAGDTRTYTWSSYEGNWTELS